VAYCYFACLLGIYLNSNSCRHFSNPQMGDINEEWITYCILTEGCGSVFMVIQDPERAFPKSNWIRILLPRKIIKCEKDHC
jgi:hypothetical protein